MTHKRLLRSVVGILCVVLLAVAVLMTAGCSGNQPTDSNVSDLPLATVVGEGDTTFAFTVVDADGKTTAYTVRTDEQTVGAALLDCGLIAGEQGDYGLYVKTVAGTTLDYDADGMYWAFYENDGYAAAGVDATAIVEGTTYSLRASK